MKCEKHIFLDLFLFYSVELFGIRVNSTILFCFQIFSVASRVSLSICSFQPGLHTVNRPIGIDLVCLESTSAEDIVSVFVEW